MQRHPVILLAVFFALLGGLLLLDLPGLGLFEPFETDVLARLPAGLAALGLGDLGLRGGGLGLAFLALAAVAWFGRVLLGPKSGIVAAFLLAGSANFVFHARQITGGAPLLLGETLALGGVWIAALDARRPVRLAGLTLGVAGFALGLAAGGPLHGVALPAGIAASTLLFLGGSTVLAGGTATVALAGIAGWLLCAPEVLRPPHVGPLAALEQLAYGWFPWSAIVPLVALRLDAEEDRPRRLIRLAALTGLVLGGVLHSLGAARDGGSPLLVALPLALGAALVLEDLSQSATPPRVALLLGIVLFVMLLRDFAQQPDRLLLAYGADGLAALPKDLHLFPFLALGSLPFLVLLGLAGTGGGERPAWQRLATSWLAPVAGLVMAGMLAIVVVPRLAGPLSSQALVQTANRFRGEDEPLAILQPGGTKITATRLVTQDDLMEWLDRSERVLAYVPRERIGEIHRALRARFHSPLFVLADAVGRFSLVTNRPASDEKNVSPITPFLRTDPFPSTGFTSVDLTLPGGAVQVLGYQILGPGGVGWLVRGEAYTITLLLRCDRIVGRDADLLLNLERNGSLIDASHAPLKGRYPTRLWQPGDHLKDVGTSAEMKDTVVPSRLPAGRYRLTAAFGPATRATEKLTLGEVEVR